MWGFQLESDNVGRYKVSKKYLQHTASCALIKSGKTIIYKKSGYFQGSRADFCKLNIKDTTVATTYSFRKNAAWVKRGALIAIFGVIGALLASCGGGGVTGGDPLKNGTLSILPNSGSLYANVPVTLNIAGGLAPYFITSNEPTVMPLNFTLNGNSFTTVPNNPGVVDPQSDPNIVPSRTVIITVRDANGVQTTATYNVIQNFMTGYGLSIQTTANCSPSGATTTSASEACAGADSLILVVPISNGLRYANKQMRFTANYGAFAFILDSTGITGPTVTSVADSAGGVTARIRVTPNAATQYAQFRMTDVATGAYRDFTFVIKNANGGNVALSALPTTITLVGATTATCGTGLVNVFAFGGLPPYTAATTFPGSISITPPLVTRSGDAFSVQIFNPNFCLGPGNVVITDAAGSNVVIDITTSPGSSPPVLPLAVAPNAVCVPDGGSAVISVSGGNSSKVINSSNPGLAVAVPTTGTGSFTPTINALGAGGAVGTLVTLTINDGANSATVSVTRKTTCP